MDAMTTLSADHSSRISTNNGDGVKNEGMGKQNYSPIFTGQRERTLSEERPKSGEYGMRDPIPVDAESYPLPDMARLLWTQVYEVRHQVEASLFGHIRPGHEYLVDTWFNELRPSSLWTSKLPKMSATASRRSPTSVVYDYDYKGKSLGYL